VANYVRTMQRTPLWDVWQIRHVATYGNGSVATRVTGFMTGIGSLVRELVVRRPAVVHLHTASYGSFARKSILAWISRSAGVPVVMHIHGAAFKEFYCRSTRLLQPYIHVTLEVVGTSACG
jgi:hypothetical protein